jgi:hypothetical protein
MPSPNHTAIAKFDEFVATNKNSARRTKVRQGIWSPNPSATLSILTRPYILIVLNSSALILYDPALIPADPLRSGAHPC